MTGGPAPEPPPAPPGPEQVVVRVPATSANLGPGFDALGLALGLWDTYTVTRRPTPQAGHPDALHGDALHGDAVRGDTGSPSQGSCAVRVEGEGAGTVAADEANLVVTAMRAAAAQAAVPLPEFDLHCDNRIPHGRGLGSSAAAIVGGVLAGRALAGLDRDTAVELAVAAALEGHPDNVAAALLGGLTVAWCSRASDDRAAPAAARAVTLSPVPLQVRVFVPPAAMSTRTARALLPASVAHVDAAHAAGRSALLVAALTAPALPDRPGALLAGTEDRLHQQVRGAVLPASWVLLSSLRVAGVAAVLSGSGPTVLALRPWPNPSVPVGADAGWATVTVPETWTVLDLDVVPGARVDSTRRGPS